MITLEYMLLYLHSINKLREDTDLLFLVLEGEKPKNRPSSDTNLPNWLNSQKEVTELSVSDSTYQLHASYVSRRDICYGESEKIR